VEIVPGKGNFETIYFEIPPGFLVVPITSYSGM